MELLNKDLNLLRVFSVIWEERSLSKAGAKLHLSQSAVSHALARMRRDFGDDLFVRDSRGMAPTDFAATLAPRVRVLLRQLDEMYRASNKFEPKKTKRNLVLSVGDYFAITMLENFVARLEAEAPHVRLICKPVSNVFELTNFEKGEIDIAITAIDVTTKEGFHSREICQEPVAICARKDHPGISRKLTADAYLALKHLNVSNYGSDKGVVDEFLEALGKKRSVALVASSFYDAGRLVRSTDFVLSAPRGICQGIADEYNLAVYPLPFAIQARSISMIWHERTHGDPFHAWARKLLLSVSP